MRVNVDRPRHDNLIHRIVGHLSAHPDRRLHDPAVAHPDVADRVAPVRWINDPSPGDAGQHASSHTLGKAAIMRVITSATEIASLAFFASTGASAPVAVRCSTPA